MKSAAPGLGAALLSLSLGLILCEGPRAVRFAMGILTNPGQDPGLGVSINRVIIRNRSDMNGVHAAAANLFPLACLSLVPAEASCG
jgi:hypothetical protein